MFRTSRPIADSRIIALLKGIEKHQVIKCGHYDVGLYYILKISERDFAVSYVLLIPLRLIMKVVEDNLDIAYDA